MGAKECGSWEFCYDYRDLEADAVLGALPDSDFIGGGTNGREYRCTVKYRANRNVQVAVTNFLNKRGSNSNYYRSLQSDLICKLH